MRSVQYERMCPAEIVAARTRAPVAYLTIGPLEWHGPQVPLGTETCTTPERLRHRGFSGNRRIYGMDYPGFILLSLYIEESALGVIIREIVEGLKHQAFRVIVLVNGHGAPNHRALLARIAVETSCPGETPVLIVGAVVDSRVRGHADLRETSYMVAHYPPTVDLDALPRRAAVHSIRHPGRAHVCRHTIPRVRRARGAGSARQATAQDGREFVQYECRRTAARVSGALGSVGWPLSPAAGLGDR